MRKTALASTAAVVGFGALVGGFSGCGTGSTLETTLLDVLGLLLQPTTQPAATKPAETGQATPTSEVEQLIQEIENVLGGPNAGANVSGANLFLAALADFASTSQNSATTQPADLAHPFRQLRTEIHNLRQSVTPEQAAILFLSALASSEAMSTSSPTSTGISGADLASRVQNLLTVLHSMNPQPTATTTPTTAP